MALAEGFEEDDAGGDGDVERFDGTGGGEVDDKVAASAVELMFLNGRSKLNGVDVFSVIQYDMQF
jgi:hypothetical protein